MGLGENSVTARDYQSRLLVGVVVLLHPLPLLEAEDAHASVGDAPSEGSTRRAGTDDQDAHGLVWHRLKLTSGGSVEDDS